MYQWARLPSVLQTGICSVLLQHFALAQNGIKGSFHFLKGLMLTWKFVDALYRWAKTVLVLVQ